MTDDERRAEVAHLVAEYVALGGVTGVVGAFKTISEHLTAVTGQDTAADELAGLHVECVALMQRIADRLNQPPEGEGEG